MISILINIAVNVVAYIALGWIVMSILSWHFKRTTKDDSEVFNIGIRNKIILWSFFWVFIALDYVGRMKKRR
jgi:hypothetical protein